MRYTSNEFIYFDPIFSGENGDFTDDSVFSPAERLEYLEKYSAFLKREYSIPNEAECVVPIERVRETLSSFNLPKTSLSHFSAYLENMPKRYKDWTLFTKKAVVDGKRLILKSAELPPNPAAEYFFDKNSVLKEIELTFIMDKEYEAENHGIIRDTTTTRSIELRCGAEEIIKLCFYHNGECYIRRKENDPYHLKFIKLGGFRFGETNHLKLRLNKGSYDVTLNQNELTEQPFLAEKIPETLYFSSGMFHFGDWELELSRVTYEDKEITDFFKEATETESDRQSIGQVTLPFAVGLVENRNRMLVLEKEFELPCTPAAELWFETLDPGGEVYIDGKRVYETDGFDSFVLDVSHLERNKKHQLRVVVFPRAPEVLYAWHRHKDSYNGWFCGEISLKCFGRCRLNDLRVVTDEVKGKNITATFSGKVNMAATLSVRIEKLYNGSSTAVNLAELSADGEFSATVSFEADAWGIGKPNLYKVTFVASTDTERVEETVETGFRTIEQRNGEILLNKERIDLKGALLMQFLPPYSKTPESHICPSSEQILWQEMMLKEMGGNTLRLHILGYGSNDERYARYADRLGILLIWTTRYIDSIESVQWQGEWRAREPYLKQVKSRINHPSIIMWEGSNELRPSLTQINDAFDRFVPAIKTVDTTRLICPISHLYYAGELYPTKDCGYFSDDGCFDHNGNPAKASPYWNDPLVVRSAHTYSLLCGYGAGWESLRLQGWSEQKNLLGSEKHAYVVSEYAVIGRQNPFTTEAQQDYFNPFSYEFPDEKPLGIDMKQEDYEISQAYQALCALEATKQMRLLNVDGLLWCCLMGGANDGGYLKPLIDNYGYKKLGFYTIRTAFQEVCAFIDGTDLKLGRGLALKPVLFGRVGERYDVTLTITDEESNPVEEVVFKDVEATDRITPLSKYIPKITAKGYYGIKLEVKEK